MFTPVALCVRAEDLAGCRTDGFDVATWVREGLVDILILGNRTTTVDVAAFRQLLAANPGPVPVTLCPMFDRHHTTDGYYDPPHGFHSAVFANFWAQGADSVVSKTACNSFLAWLGCDLTAITLCCRGCSTGRPLPPRPTCERPLSHSPTIRTYFIVFEI